MRIKIPLTLTFLLPAVGCIEDKPKETHSAIVTYAEAHGSGDLHQASTESIQLWVKSHRPLAGEIFQMCRSQAPGDVTWGNTTEGHLCLAVRRESFWGFRERARR